MDPEQFQQFMKKQNELVTKLVAGLQQKAAPVSNISSVVPPPPALSLDGDMEENYEFFLTNWKNYSQAVGMDSWPDTQASKKVSFLMSVIGEAALKKYYNFSLTEAQQNNINEALTAIKQKVVRSRNLFVDRLDFFAANQLSSEFIDDYAARLQSLAKPCKLAGLVEQLVLFKVVTSNKWEHLRTKMLTMQDLTMDKAVDICRMEEISEQRLRQLALELSPVGDVKKIRKENKKKLQRCKFCGDEHVFVKGACPAYGKKCKRCGGRNHFEKACKIEKPWKQKRRHRRVREVKNDESSSDERFDSSGSESYYEDSEHEVQIAKIVSKSTEESSALAVLDFKVGRKWKPVTCEIDTGANATVIGYNHLAKLLEIPNPTLQPTSIKLKSFGDDSIPVLGQVMLPVKRKGKRYQLFLQVVDHDHRPLLSLKASQSLGLVKFCGSVKLRQHETTNEEEMLRNINKVTAEPAVESYSHNFDRSSVVVSEQKREIVSGNEATLEKAVFGRVRDLQQQEAHKKSWCWAAAGDREFWNLISPTACFCSRQAHFGVSTINSIVLPRVVEAVPNSDKENGKQMDGYPYRRNLVHLKSRKEPNTQPNRRSARTTGPLSSRRNDAI